MTAPGLDQQAHWDAVTELVAIPEWPTFDAGDVPGLDGNAGITPPRYVVVDVERRYVPTSRPIAQASTTGWRATCEVFAATHSEVRAGLAHLSRVLDGPRLTVDGHTSTPIQHDATEDPDRDGRIFSALASWTYAL